MTRVDVIALAVVLRDIKPNIDAQTLDGTFRTEVLEPLADFCRPRSPQFDYEEWLAYIYGEGRLEGDGDDDL